MGSEHGKFRLSRRAFLTGTAA
ncbi:MAG: hypothetical protein AVDCRST_MAG88-1257, partial [uncultured Thermomicrobiales bacterium]